ncbi:transposable element Tc3 transposase [Trichonephila clavipes]|nr:transposable element Tc3 transposase [Trichonephila clavipes]
MMSRSWGLPTRWRNMRHTARATIDLLKDTFVDRRISRFGPVNWPPRSCDLTPLDYFLWGYEKSLVYADEPQTLTIWKTTFAVLLPIYDHKSRATIDLLKDTFGDRLISRFGPVNWPPRSCDLTPLDYFLWGYVKSLVYVDKPQTLDHLEDNIRRVIADIRPQMLEKVNENWTSKLDYIRASRGSPMPEIIFKM